jgi:hypothetical protein
VGGDAFVVAVVPFTDVLGDFDGGVGTNVFGGCGRGVGPWVGGFAADVEEFEGSLGAVTGGYETKKLLEGGSH